MEWNNAGTRKFKWQERNSHQINQEHAANKRITSDFACKNQ